jgi:hypothetical protein
VEFEDGEAAVAFASKHSDLSDALELKSDETIDKIKGEIHLYLLVKGDTLEEIKEFAIVHVGDAVHFAFKINKEIHSRAASAEIEIQPIVTREKAIEQEQGGGSGGCDAGAASFALLLFAGAGAVKAFRKYWA